jgi:hypothetical protein
VRIYIDAKEATVNFDISMRVGLSLEPGLWVVQESEERQCSVTSMRGIVDGGGFVHWGWPKGVVHYAGGSWKPKEFVLHKAMPPGDHPVAAWGAIPAGIRAAIIESYLLARANLPEEMADPCAHL